MIFICYNCGCKQPNEDHGDPENNLIEKDMQKAGAAESMEGAGITRAKENILELLMLQQEDNSLEDPKVKYGEE